MIASDPAIIVMLSSHASEVGAGPVSSLFFIFLPLATQAKMDTSCNSYLNKDSCDVLFLC